MISTRLLLYCLLVGGIYLLVISAVLDWMGKRLKVSRGVTSGLMANGGWIGFATNYAVDFFFFVLIPILAYSFFYLILPLSGLRAGMAGALFAFTIGAVPAMVGFGLRVNFSMLYLLYYLLSLLLKLGGCLGIIGYLYDL